MSHNFKPGDLALVIKSRDAEMLGRTVEILEVLLDTMNGYEAYGEIHEGDADGSPSAFIDFGGDYGVWLFRQDSLMPMNGNFEPDQQKAKETEPCL